MRLSASSIVHCTSRAVVARIIYAREQIAIDTHLPCPRNEPPVSIDDFPSFLSLPLFFARWEGFWHSQWCCLLTLETIVSEANAPAFVCKQTTWTGTVLIKLKFKRTNVSDNNWMRVSPWSCSILLLIALCVPYVQVHTPWTAIQAQAAKNENGEFFAATGTPVSIRDDFSNITYLAAHLLGHRRRKRPFINQLCWAHYETSR